MYKWQHPGYNAVLLREYVGLAMPKGLFDDMAPPGTVKKSALRHRKDEMIPSGFMLRAQLSDDQSHTRSDY